MKRYEEALKDLPEYPNDFICAAKEIYQYRSPESEEDIIQAPMHMLKAAQLFVSVWVKDNNFGPEVEKTIKDVDYNTLDLFQKAVYHVLSFCPYHDKKFDFKAAKIKFDWDVKEWKHSLNI